MIRTLIHKIQHLLVKVTAPSLIGRAGGESALFLLFFLSSCTAESPTPSLQEGEEADYFVCSLPITFGFAPDNDGTTRAPGDPGTYETFEKPRYAYIYFVALLPGDETQVCKFADILGEELTTTNPLTLAAAEWSEDTNGDVFPQADGDKLYVHSGTYNFKVPTGVTTARVYAIASYDVLPNLTPAITLGTSTEAEVLSQTFDVINGTDNISTHLKDIYSTPYNYENTSGVYYATVPAYSGTPLHLMLYHVAAKVDVKWNVAEDKQATYHISYIQARQLKQKGCKIFKPTENTWTIADEGTGNNYSLDLMDGDIGQQWLGRQYFYTIPYRPTFNVHLHFLKNGDDKATYAATGYNLKLTKDISPIQNTLKALLRKKSEIDLCQSF